MPVYIPASIAVLDYVAAVHGLSGNVHRKARGRHVPLARRALLTDVDPAQALGAPCLPSRLTCVLSVGPYTVN